MKPITREWVKKAEQDFAAAVQLARRRKSPLHDVVCFHSQQCLEKYLKARLCEAGLAIPKTHNLEALLDLVLPAEPLWAPFRPVLQLLASSAVELRYPGVSATKPEARRSLADCKTLRREVRLSLGLRA
jgi:HEPN domain-containing protein